MDHTQFEFTNNVGLNRMENKEISFYTIRELQTWPDIALQRFGKHLYKKACEEQQRSASHERNEEEYCHTSVRCVEQIREVSIVLHRKGKNFRNDFLEYVFSRIAGTETASVISEIVRTRFIDQHSEVITSTRFSCGKDGRAVLITTFSPNRATRAGTHSHTDNRDDSIEGNS